jgi:hypothetical protein
MTPKEKAQELLSHYNSILIDEISHGGARGYASYKCALIAVDEILDAIDWDYYEGSAQTEHNYWKEVKQEIEKL